MWTNSYADNWKVKGNLEEEKKGGERICRNSEEQY